MKKFLKLFIFVLCLCFSLPVLAEEKINNFEVYFTLNEDASATVKEYITVTAEHDKIKRGLYRNIPQDSGRNIKIESLYLDGKEHPYVVKSEAGVINVSFGTEELLPFGEHTYVLTYALEHTLSTGFFRDFLLWPVTGGSWTLPIDKASFFLSVPYAVTPIKEKIISYTDGKKTKDFVQTESNVFTFHAAKPLKEGEMFSIYFPMKKGIFQFKWYEIEYMPAFLCFLIVIYYFIIWYLIGRDPAKSKLPYRIKPPKGVSAGFASYFLNGPFSPKNLATVFASLVVKKKIKLTFPKWKPAECEKIDDAYGDLEEDEIRLMMSIPDEFKFNKEGLKYLHKGLVSINYYYENKIGDYVINNFIYMIFPIVFFVVILFYFNEQGVIPEILLALIVNFLVPIIIGVYTKNIRKIIWIVAVFIIGTGALFSYITSSVFLLNPNVLAILITTFLTALFTHLMNNLMFEGVVLRDELDAFKEYMSIAERDRVALSNPSVAGRIFCDYLPYAYAFGMESIWFKKFKNKIDFRLRDIYEPMATKSVLSVGLLVTITSAMNSGKVGDSLIGKFGGGGFVGKGRFGGGGGR